MHGHAEAPGAISVVNAIPAGRGASAAIDRTVSATVELDPTAEAVTGAAGDVDPTLVERCVARTTVRFGSGEGGHIRTESTLPASVGLKTSSAAANAAIEATLDALDVTVDPLEVARIGVGVAREAGVTITGAFDDAAASALGGMCVTDNRTDTLLDRRTIDRPVVIVVPDRPAPTAAVDVGALEAVNSICDHAVNLALDGEVPLAMSINGLAVGMVLDLDPAPVRSAIDRAAGVSVSGTGPAIAAIGDEAACDAIAERWVTAGRVIRTRLRSSGLDRDG